MVEKTVMHLNSYITASTILFQIVCTYLHRNQSRSSLLVTTVKVLCYKGGSQNVQRESQCVLGFNFHYFCVYSVTIYIYINKNFTSKQCAAILHSYTFCLHSELFEHCDLKLPLVLRENTNTTSGRIELI